MVSKKELEKGFISFLASKLGNAQGITSQSSSSMTNKMSSAPRLEQIQTMQEVAVGVDGLIGWGGPDEL